MKKLTQIEAKIFNYLNQLRLYGKVNMFFAAPYIIKNYGLTEKAAIKILKYWMHNFKDDKNWIEGDTIKI